MIDSTAVQGRKPLFSRPRVWLLGLLLAAATFTAYFPAWNGKPIWDDAAHMPHAGIRSWTGLLHIWTEPGTTLQYYPVAFSSFWVEHKLWGDATLGYHLVNILLHVTGALLLLRILQTLEVPAAWLAAAIFALHPIEVESVAWIAELKNTLSGICYLGAGLAYLGFDRTRNKRAYVAALALFALGLLTKTVIATLPAALLVVFWWKRGALSWRRDVPPLVPFFVAGITAGLFTSWMERYNVGANGTEFHFTLVERCLIAGRAVWFYLGKLFWPADLIFSYPRWTISQAVWWQYLFPAGVAAMLLGFWVLRRWTRGPSAAMLFFIGTLFPALGFLNVFPFKYSFVADHFQYLAGIGPIVAASVAIHAIFSRVKERRLEMAFCAALLALLAVLTWRQCRMYTDIETLWRTTIARNPDCWLAHDDLGAVLYERGDVDRAIAQFRASLAIEPDNAEAENNLGAALDKKHEMDEAMAHYRKAFALRPRFAEAHWNLGNDFLGKGRVDDAILEYRKAEAIRPDSGKLYLSLGNALLGKGEVDEAIDQFRAMLELQPDSDQAHYSLGIALHQKGEANAAIDEFQKAVGIHPDFLEAQNNLGSCLLQQGRVDEAITHLRKALEINPDYPQSRYNLGDALLQKRQVDEAVTQFQKLVALQPNSAQARESLGNALVQQGRVDEAISELQKALQLATRQNNASLIATLQTQLSRYKSRAR
ncbi:MAG TPA: tetratricopeptide repeat protein [Verrucomicrobiae bacterium]|jgi:tetratricopeptide (TPR) repeat protein|nr:tetratricopeptide repeat protein [Verrucomicrobiae bacterium]